MGGDTDRSTIHDSRPISRGGGGVNMIALKIARFVPGARGSYLTITTLVVSNPHPAGQLWTKEHGWCVVVDTS